MYNHWKKYLSIRLNRVNLLVTFLLLIPVLAVIPNYLAFIETRNGFSFSDPLLRLFKPIDVTWFTFSFIYAGLILALFHLRNYPKQMLLAFKVYAVTGMLRMIGMYFLPLNPPESMIILNDPFVQFFGSGEILTKDLFFSGHTSTMFIMFLTAQTKVVKTFFLIATIFIAIFVLVQHVHYTIDVFAAPFFAFAAYKLSGQIDNYFNG